ASVHRFATSVLLAGSPTPVLASGPPAGSLRYIASRPLYFRPVPPRLFQRRAHRPGRFGTSLRDLLTSGRFPHARFSVGPTGRVASVHRFATSVLPAGSPTPVSASGPPAGSLRYIPSRPPYFRPVPPRPF